MFAIFSCIDLFAISPISPTSSPTSYHPCKVGVVSSGSGATGHCAGANRPGKSLSEVCGLLCAFKTRFQLILPVHSHNVSKNMTGHRINVEGPLIYQINRQTNSFQIMCDMLLKIDRLVTWAT